MVPGCHFEHIWHEPRAGLPWCVPKFTVIGEPRISFLITKTYFHHIWMVSKTSLVIWAAEPIPPLVHSVISLVDHNGAEGMASHLSIHVWDRVNGPSYPGNQEHRVVWSKNCQLSLKYSPYTGHSSHRLAVKHRMTFRYLWINSSQWSMMMYNTGKPAPGIYGQSKLKYAILHHKITIRFVYN